MGLIFSDNMPNTDAEREAFTGDWSVGLFECYNDIGGCLYGWCCPACLYGKTSEIVDDDCMKPCLCFALCGLCTVCKFAPDRRNKMRDLWKLKHGGLAESACITWCCCPSCANCQEAGE